MDLAAEPLGEVEVVPVEGVLRPRAAPGHAAAAERAAGPLGAASAEVGIRDALAGLAEEDPDLVLAERGAAPGLRLDDLLQELVRREHLRRRRRAQHPARGRVVGRERRGPVGARRPERIAKHGLGRDDERVRVHQAPAPDARAVEHHHVRKDRELLDPVEPEPRHPQELAQVPVGLGEVLRPPALAHLEDRDAPALLGEPERRHGPAEPGADHEEVVVELHVAPPFTRSDPSSPIRR